MIAVSSFEDELTLLKKDFKHDNYEYRDPSTSFSDGIDSHFKDRYPNIRKEKKYGVYLVRQRDSKEVLYVGKGGTVDSQGHFKGQDILRRLKNVKTRDVYADDWFRSLLQEKGHLVIEYIFLPISKSPAFVEAALLQAYLNEHHRLPYKNKSL